MKLRDIEIVEDRTDRSNCREGYLRLSRLRVCNHYEDGSKSETYDCDIVTRPYPDAVAICLYHLDQERRIHVVLKEGTRPPIYLRKHTNLLHADERPYHRLIELAAGLLEAGDSGVDGIARRARAEASEETGFDVAMDCVHTLGGGTFASPGISDEKVHFCSAQLEHLDGGAISGDGSTMEEGTCAVVLDLVEAITMCRDGRIPDMKTEVGLLRLADHIGYIPQLGKFVHELAPDLQSLYSMLGV